jgi:hypothetical protein
MALYEVEIEYVVTAVLQIDAANGEEVEEYADDVHLVEYANSTIGLNGAGEYDHSGTLRWDGEMRIVSIER